MAHEQTEKFARALRGLRANDPALTRLSLGGYDMRGEEEASLLAEALRFNSTLRTLILCSNGICVGGAHALAGALCVNSTLRCLGLRDNNIDVGGARALAEALHVNSTLRELCLSHNNVGDDGTRAFAGALCVNSTLRTLNLWCNNIGEQGTSLLADALRVNSTLRKLFMDDSSEEISRYLQRNRHNARARATPLKILCWQAVLKLNDPVQIALVPPLLRENSTSFLSKIDFEFKFY